MNRRYIIIVAIGLAILAVTVWRGCQKKPEQVVSPTLSEYFAHRSGHIDPKRNKEPTAQEEREAIVREKSIAFAKRNNAPIAFYGRVVDQDGKPLQGVAVEFTVTAIPMIPLPWGPDKSTNESCVTDQNGLFSVDGKRGVSLGVRSLRKSGYRESGYYLQGHARYEPYSPQRHIPDRNKPVEFMLIRDDLPKSEEVYDRRLRLNWNAGATTENLGPDVGKLEFTARRTGRDPANTIKKFEWEVKMRATGFTLVKLLDENSRITPLAGYSPTERIGFLPDEKAWLLRPDGRYAILTESGAFGLMELSIYADGDDGGMSGSVTVYLNKSGARNIDHK